jgi:hypothetical protein
VWAREDRRGKGSFIVCIKARKVVVVGAMFGVRGLVNAVDEGELKRNYGIIVFAVGIILSPRLLKLRKKTEQAPKPSSYCPLPRFSLSPGLSLRSYRYSLPRRHLLYHREHCVHDHSLLAIRPFSGSICGIVEIAS